MIKIASIYIKKKLVFILKKKNAKIIILSQLQ
jgi:hypothetical protein